MTGGLLQKELLEEAEGYLIQKGIYDVTLIEECDFREYKKLLIDSGRYTRQSAVERSSALRKNQRYWVEQEYGELLAEIKECQVSDAPLKGNIQRFLIRQGIHHIKDIDYTTRSRYEAELQKTGNEQRVMKYLKVFDHIKQYSIKQECSWFMGNLGFMKSKPLICRAFAENRRKSLYPSPLFYGFPRPQLYPHGKRRCSAPGASAQQAEADLARIKEV